MLRVCSVVRTASLLLSLVVVDLVELFALLERRWEHLANILLLQAGLIADTRIVTVVQYCLSDLADT